MRELRERYLRVVMAQRGTLAGERRIRMAEELIAGAERGEISQSHAVQMMRRLHGSVEIE
ncbi:hypothetical protein H0N95_00690 [Candidatus Micrarchaeota archaeon]|nr:hypothetical protein [Candidatus Micrarchaeota archaeon]